MGKRARTEKLKLSVYMCNDEDSAQRGNVYTRLDDYNFPVVFRNYATSIHAANLPLQIQGKKIKNLKLKFCVFAKTGEEDPPILWEEEVEIRAPPRYLPGNTVLLKQSFSSFLDVTLECHSNSKCTKTYTTIRRLAYHIPRSLLGQ